MAFRDFAASSVSIRLTSFPMCTRSPWETGPQPFALPIAPLVEVDDFIGVGHSTTKEVGDERNLRPDRHGAP